MEKVKLIVHECFQGKRKMEDVFAAVFLSDTAALTTNAKTSMMQLIEQSQDSLGSEKGAVNGTSEE